MERVEEGRKRRSIVEEAERRNRLSRVEGKKLEIRNPNKLLKKVKALYERLGPKAMIVNPILVLIKNQNLVELQSFETSKFYKGAILILKSLKNSVS